AWITGDLQSMSKKVLTVTALSVWVIIRIGIIKILIHHFLGPFSIKLYSVIMLIQIIDYIFICKGILIHQFTWPTPGSISIHKDLLWLFFLCFQRFIHRHPFDLLGL